MKLLAVIGFVLFSLLEVLATVAFIGFWLLLVWFAFHGHGLGRL
jgi:hypothetical protein